MRDQECRARDPQPLGAGGEESGRLQALERPARRLHGLERPAHLATGQRLPGDGRPWIASRERLVPPLRLAMELHRWSPYLGTPATRLTPPPRAADSQKQRLPVWG